METQFGRFAHSKMMPSFDFPVLSSRNGYSHLTLPMVPFYCNLRRNVALLKESTFSSVNVV